MRFSPREEIIGVTGKVREKTKRHVVAPDERVKRKYYLNEVT